LSTVTSTSTSTIISVPAETNTAATYFQFGGEQCTTNIVSQPLVVPDGAVTADTSISSNTVSTLNHVPVTLNSKVKFSTATYDTGIVPTSATSTYNGANGSYCIAAPPWTPYITCIATGNDAGTVPSTSKLDCATNHFQPCTTICTTIQDINIYDAATCNTATLHSAVSIITY
jgi:hypothetical protein